MNDISESRSKITKNYLWLGSRHLLTTGFLAAVGIYLTRTLGPDSYGLYMLSYYIVSFSILIGDSGLRLYGTRQVAQAEGYEETVAFQICSVRMIVAVVVVLIASTTLFILPIDRHYTIAIGTMIFWAIPYQLNLDWAYQGMQKMAVPTITNIVLGVILLFSCLLLVRDPSDIIVAIICLVSSSTTAYILQGIHFLGICHKRASLRLPNIREIVAHYKGAFVIGLSGVIINLYYHTDSILLGFIHGNAEVGIYSAAYQIVLPIASLGAMLGYSAYPVYSRLINNADHNSVKSDSVRSVFGIGIAIGLPVSIFITLISDEVISVLYGDAYYDSSLVLRILIWNVFTVFCNVAFAFYLLSSGLNKQYLMASVAGFVLNVVVNLLLIPKFSTTGASVATIITEFTVLLVLVYFCSKVVKFNPWVDIFKTCLCSIGMTLSILFFTNNLVLAVIVAGISYFSLCILLKSPLYIEARKLTKKGI